MDQRKSKVCGIDVHKSFVVATILDSNGTTETKKYIQSIEDLTRLRDWILEKNCESVAFESTADYWRTLHTIISPSISVTVANAYHIKHIPGKKTDISDSHWIAQLELSNLITPSRIFSGYQYDLRALTRSRTKIRQSRTVFKNKIHHILDLCAIRLCTVMKDVFGKSGYVILKGLIERKSFDEIVKSLPKKMQKYADKYLSVIPENIPENVLILLQSFMSIIDTLNSAMTQIEEQIKVLMNSRHRELRILMSVPGIGFISASIILSEIGNIHDFSNSDKLAKWVGITPSVYQSANTNYTGSITKQGTKHLRWILVECAHVAIRSQGMLRDYFLTLLPKKGYKKAIVAVARKILRIIWHLLVNDEEFKDNVPRLKEVRIPITTKSVEKMGIQKIIDLLSRGVEMIIEENGKEVIKVKLD